MPTHSRQQGSCNSLHPWKRPLEVTNQHTVWVLPSLTMDTVWDAADITLYHNGADEDTVHAWRASKEEGGGRAKGFKIISFQNWELLLLTIHIFLFENRDLRNLIKARRGEIEPTHDFTFSLIGQYYSKLQEDNHYSAIGRFSGLHKLQILDFIFNDPTILGNLEVKRWCFTFHQMTLTSSTRVTMLGRCYSTSKWVFQKKTKGDGALFNQPEETEEDRVAHENLKKVKASERSVVAMQAKYKVRSKTQIIFKLFTNWPLVI